MLRRRLRELVIVAFNTPGDGLRSSSTDAYKVFMNFSQNY